MKQLVALFLLLFCFAGPALAVNPDEVLADPVLEARARDISANLRCLVCQNQSIDDSDADLAADLRVLVRERLTEGDSDAEVMSYIVARYGEFVRLNPVLAPHTIVLWLAAPTLLLIGFIALLMRLRRLQPSPVSPVKLTGQEEAALAGLADSDDSKV